MKKEFEAFTEMQQSIQQSMIGELTRRIQAQRQEVFMKRLQDLGIEIDLEEEQYKGHKQFFRVVQGDEETIYFKDGSERGQRIVTFINKVETEFYKEDFNLTVSTSYY